MDLELGGPGIPAVLHAAGLRYCVMPLPAEEGSDQAPGSAEEPGDEEDPADDEEVAPEVEEELSASTEPVTTA